MVRAGATVVWSTYSLNRDPRRYGEDWAEFKPDRWATLLRPTKSSNSNITTAATTTTSGAESGSSPDAKRQDGGLGSTAHVAEIGEGWRGAFMPFGSGPRTCLGQTMVQTEVTYVLVRLLQEFPTLAMDESDAARPFREAKAVSFYNEGGVNIRLQ